MLKRFLEILKNREIIIYIFFGILTTAVNWMICLPLHYMFGIAASISNAIAWFISVLFAFFTNKPFVFQSHDWNIKTVLAEAAEFFGGRILTGTLETGILALMVDYLGFSGFIWKLIASIVVIILNYVFSKIIFRKK